MQFQFRGNDPVQWPQTHCMLNVSDLVLSPASVQSVTSFNSGFRFESDATTPIGSDDDENESGGQFHVMDEYRADDFVLSYGLESESLASNPAGIVDLSCQCVMVLPKGIETLLTSVHQWSVRRLHFWADAMSAVSSLLFAKTLKRQPLSSLHILCLGGKNFEQNGSDIARSLALLPNLRDLTIEGSWLSDADVPALGTIMRDSSTLVSLALVETTSLSKKGIHLLAQELSHADTLQMLRFEGFLDDDGMVSICSGLRHDRIISLRLSEFRFKKRGCEALAAFVRRSGILERLLIDENELVDEDCGALAAAMKEGCVPREMSGAPDGDNGISMRRSVAKNQVIYRRWKRTSFCLALQRRCGDQSYARLLHDSAILDRNCMNVIFHLANLAVSQDVQVEVEEPSLASDTPLLALHRSV